MTDSTLLWAQVSLFISVGSPRLVIPIALLVYALVRQQQRAASMGERIGRPLSLLVGVLPAAYVIICAAVPRRLVFGFGGGTWGLAVVAKLILCRRVVVRHLEDHLGKGLLGLVQGAISGLTELGTAASFSFLLTAP